LKPVVAKPGKSNDASGSIFAWISAASASSLSILAVAMLASTRRRLSILMAARLARVVSSASCSRPKAPTRPVVSRYSRPKTDSSCHSGAHTMDVMFECRMLC